MQFNQFSRRLLRSESTQSATEFSKKLASLKDNIALWRTRQYDIVAELRPTLDVYRPPQTVWDECLQLPSDFNPDEHCHLALSWVESP